MFGDPDQSIYAFRGSDPAALRDIEVDSTVSLTVSRRLAPAILTATRRVPDRLPGYLPHRALTTGSPALRSAAAESQTAGGARRCRPAGEVVVRTLPTAAREAAFIADELRRAHLRAAVPWSRMAVLVRSPVASLPALRRAFAAAGVPLTVSGQDTDVDRGSGGRGAAHRPAVRPATVAADRPGRSGSAVITRGRDGRRGVAPAAPARSCRPPGRWCHPRPVGGGAGRGAAAGRSPRRAEPPRAPGARHAGRRHRAGARRPRRGIQPVAGLAARRAWRTPWSPRRCGVAGPASGRTAPWTRCSTLFAMAADLADRMPLAGVGAFLDLVDGQRIPGDPTAGTARSADAVAVLSAHAAKGLEWDVVCLAGVSEGRWPVLRTRPSLLGTEEVLDAAAGLPAAALDSSAASAGGAAAVLRRRDQGQAAADRHRGRRPGHGAVQVPARARGHRRRTAGGLADRAGRIGRAGGCT